MQKEKYYARICWNSKGWQHPTGESYKIEKNSHASQYGYGHEEWLFNKDMQLTDEIDGEKYQYGFLQPLSTKNRVGKNLNTILWTINDLNERVIVAEIDDLHVLGQVQRELIHKKYGNKFYSLMKNDLLAKGIDTSKLKDTYDDMNLVNVRFKLSSLKKPDRHKPISKDSVLNRFSRYKLVKEDSITFNKEKNNNKDKKKGGEDEILRYGKEVVRVKREHNKIQNALIGLFASQGIDSEKEVSYVDIVETNKNGDLTFYEIKVCDSAHKCIREALGQLLAYHYRAFKKPIKLVIVGNCTPDNDDIKFIESIRNMTKLNVYYCAWVKGKLTKEI